MPARVYRVPHDPAVYVAADPDADPQERARAVQLRQQCLGELAGVFGQVAQVVLILLTGWPRNLDRERFPDGLAVEPADDAGQRVLSLVLLIDVDPDDGPLVAEPERRDRRTRLPGLLVLGGQQLLADQGLDGLADSSRGQRLLPDQHAALADLAAGNRSPGQDGPGQHLRQHGGAAARRIARAS